MRILALFVLLSAVVGCSKPDDSLACGFAHIPARAKPHVWWHWMNGNVTKEGITADLEAMAKAGIGGAQIFDAGCAVPPGALRFNTPDWFDYLTYAAQEARRLGIELCLPNCSGWSSSGGPWNPPENQMKTVDWTVTKVKGGGRVEAKLPLPKETNGFYEDIGVFAVAQGTTYSPAEQMARAGVKISSPDFPDRQADLDQIIDDDYATSIVYTDSARERVFTLSFPEPYRSEGVQLNLGSLDMCWQTDGRYRLDVSDDGETWRCIDEKRVFVMRFLGANSLHTFVFDKPVTARYWRFTVCCYGEPETRVSFRRLWIGTVGGSVTRLPERTLARLDFGQGYGFADEHDDPNHPAPQSVDVSSYMKPDGSFAWDAPEGSWKIYRIGYRGTGKCNHPASYGGEGFEVDKLDAKALDFHFEAYVAKLMKKLGPLGGNVESGLNNILVDSYEVGPQNWVRGFREIFKERMGYDMWKYLPVICGETVDGLEASDRFLWDYRRVLCDLFAENYAHALQKKCHEYGLKFSLEGYGIGDSDDLQYGRYCDVPMAEYWTAADDISGSAGNSKNAASICHVWGQPIAATESFTGEPTIARAWTKTPFGLKAQGDKVFACGINRIIYHRYAMQPWQENIRPGMTMGRWGTHFERTLTWWEHGAADWLAYQGRCQYLLQEGRPVVTALLYNGEDTPNAAAVGYMPRGYWWDAITTDALRELKVKDGKIVAPSGNTFDLLVLATNDRAMTPETLAKLEELAAAGAKISGEKAPEKARGLRDWPASDKIVADRAAALWGKGVFTGTRVEALKHFALAPDVVWEGTDDEIVFVHRRYDDGTDGYFVARPMDGEKTMTVSFATAKGFPELWDAEDGSRVRAKDWKRVGDRTEVTLRFTPAKSWFVMFRPTEDTALAVEKPFVAAKTTDLAGTWKLSVPVLPPAGAAPTGKTVELALEKLVDWSTSANDEVKYFSGTVTYEAPVLPADAFGAGRTVLDLGEVHDMAEVWLDGQKLATLWRPPFRVALPPSAAKGKLVVKVTNTWPNRLIGDERQYAPDVAWGNQEDKDGISAIPAWVTEGGVSPSGRRCFTTWHHWTAKDNLLPAGLLGPVKLLAE